MVDLRRPVPMPPEASAADAAVADIAHPAADAAVADIAHPADEDAAVDVATVETLARTVPGVVAVLLQPEARPSA